jgi:hypothetical protein
VVSATANVAVTGEHRSGSTTKRTGRDCPGASTTDRGSKCTSTVGAVVGSHTSPGSSVVVEDAGVDGAGDDVHPQPTKSASAAKPRRVVRFMKWRTL